jgi:hypothetical protein
MNGVRVSCDIFHTTGLNEISWTKLSVAMASATDLTSVESSFWQVELNTFTLTKHLLMCAPFSITWEFRPLRSITILWYDNGSMVNNVT